MIPAPRALALAALLTAALGAPAVALGTTITVTTTADTIDGDGRCSLREAVIRANTDVSIDGECDPGPAGADVIVLGPGTFRLARAGRGEAAARTGDLDVTGTLEIAGAGAARTTVDGAALDRVFDVLPGAAVTIRDLTVTGGSADGGVTPALQFIPDQGNFGGTGTAGACGGGIAASSATLTLSGLVVTGNAGGAGGTGGTVTGPTSLIGRGGDGGPGGPGGGICAFSTPVTLTRSVVSGNRAGEGGDGGNGFGGLGLAAAGGVGAGGSGGPGIGGQGGAGGTGGGIVHQGVGAFVAVDSTVSGNRAGGGGDAGNGTGGAGGGGGTVGPQGMGIGNGAGSAGSGGGIGGNSVLSVSRSTISGNVAGTGGQGGVGVSATSSIGGNGGSGGDGGGVHGIADPQTLVNVTVAGNFAGGGGGGGAHSAAASVTAGLGGRGGRGGGLASESDLTVSHVTVAGNGAGAAGGAAPGGVSGAAGAAGTPGSGTSAGVWSSGLSTLARSVFSGNSCDTASVSIVDLLDVALGSSGCPGAALDPRLGAPADNGGPTATMRPGAASAVIDRIVSGGCPATDQRGAVRPSGAGCDTGAVEIAPPSATTGAASALTGSTASVAGTIDTRGLDTSYRVDFGATTAYGRQVAGAVTGAAAPSAVSVPLTGLTPLTTYHYRLVATGPDGTATGADRTLTTTAATVAGGPGAPLVTRLTISPRVFAVAPRRGALRPGSRKRVARGAIVRFRLSQAARVVLVVERNVVGRRIRLRSARSGCVAVRAGRRVPAASRCTLHPSIGSLTRAGTTGPNRVVFRARLGRKARALTPGTYRLVAIAIDGALRSRQVRVPFTIIRP